MRHDLREVELGGDTSFEKMTDLTGGVAMRVGPTAERKPGLMLADPLAQLPRVIHAARRAHAFVAAQHNERPEPCCAARSAYARQ